MMDEWIKFIQIGGKAVDDFLGCGELSLLLPFMFSFFPFQLVWNPGMVFPHHWRTVAEFFPRSHAETSREAGKLERRQAADGGNWEPLSSASGDAGRVSTRCCWQKPFSGKILIKHQVVKLIWNCQSAFAKCEVKTTLCFILDFLYLNWQKRSHLE